MLPVEEDAAIDALTIVTFIVGFALLVFGARLLVDGASALAESIGLSPLVIGLTIVAFGSSAPELAIGIQSTFTGEDGIGVGNVVGTGVFNVLFVLGIAAIISPLMISSQLIKRDGTLMLVTSVLLLILALDQRINRLEGVLLVLILIVYTVRLVRKGREGNEIKAKDEEGAERSKSRLLQVAQVVGGLVLLVVGAQWLVDSSVQFAEALGLSPVVIGLTIVAAGTSAPEVATTILAVARGEHDLAVGNIVGSNIFNVLAVIGLTAVVSPDGISISQELLEFNIPVLIFVSFVALLTFASEYEIARWEGVLFLLYYAVYTIMLLLSATGSDALDWFGPIAIVVGVAGLLLLIVRAIQARKAAGSAAPG